MVLKFQLGFALFLSGLPGSGVGALSYALQATFNQFSGARHITLLDAASVPKESVPFVTAELVRSGAGVIIANTEEVYSTKEAANLKKTVSKAGSFITVSVETPVEGSKVEYTAPEDAEITTNFAKESINVAIQRVVLYLEEQGFFKF
ncbi:unnamed protein product [Ambrosiozyma monospora]|uniref:Unnamed protein product n=1 Tax=Ambrosiozyma monospora TaxID=43982 RepID=A0A9W6YZV2_AMBMO|nr:unnamed protein product [Ambrosiozyma monospora]